MMLVWHRLNAAGTAYEAQGIIEDAHAVVWTERWQAYGEAQVDLPPTHDVRTDDLLTMPERDMAVEVVGRTETEKGVQLRCRDALSILDRRIVYPTVSNNGLVRTFVQKLMSPYIGPTARGIRPLRLGDISAITASANVQRSYVHAGEALVELGATYGFDPTCALSGGLLVVGARTNDVQRVWGMGRNLAGYAEDVDTGSFRNVAYVGVQEDAHGNRVVKPVGSVNVSNLKRREEFVDRRDLAVTGMDRDALETAYGAITRHVTATAYVRTEGSGPSAVVVDMSFETEVKMDDLDATAVIESLRQATNNDSVVAQMIAAASTEYSSYTGTYSSTAGGWQFTIGSTSILLPESVLGYASFALTDSSTTKVLNDVGKGALADLQPETAFEAVVEGLTPYVDYGLGDTVAVFKADGSRKDMRVVEVVESWDSQGYKATPGLASL